MHCHFITQSDLIYVDTEIVYVQMLHKFEKQVDHLMEQATNELRTKIPTWT